MSEILSVEISKQNVGTDLYFLELRTANVDYYVTEEIGGLRSWDVAIRQALMPVDTPKPPPQQANNHKGLLLIFIFWFIYAVYNNQNFFWVIS